MSDTHAGRRGMTHDTSRGHDKDTESHSGSAVEDKVIHGRGMSGGGEHETGVEPDHAH